MKPVQSDCPSRQQTLSVRPRKTGLRNRYAEGASRKGQQAIHSPDK